ncbi:lysozyme inhibitor LprI family protein [Brucella pituitosa]
MEKAICSKPDIAEADRAMSIAYSALIERADPALKEALRNDQSAFIKIRAEAFESNLSNLENRLTGLLDRTDMRAEFLNWISVTDNSSLEGNWSNAWGAIEVEKKPSGQLAVNVNVADQANGTWVCSFEGVIEQKSAGEAEFKGEGGPLVLRLEGATLNIPTPFCDELRQVALAPQPAPIFEWAHHRWWRLLMMVPSAIGPYPVEILRFE